MQVEGRRHGDGGLAALVEQLALELRQTRGELRVDVHRLDDRLFQVVLVLVGVLATTVATLVATLVG